MRIILYLAALLLFSPMIATAADDAPIIIYDGDEESFASFTNHELTLAMLKGADYLVLPLMLSKDDVVMVYDDFLLNPKTNVADIFPGRERSDGNFYLIDFTALELEQLSLRDQLSVSVITQHISRLEDANRIISHINSQLSRNTGIVLELKYPWFHRNEKKDISRVVLDLIANRPVMTEGPILLQCYEPEELQRINDSLLEPSQHNILLIQRVDTNNGKETMQRLGTSWTPYNYDWIYSRIGLRVLAKYVDIIVLPYPTSLNNEEIKRYVEDIHDLKLRVLFDLTGSHYRPQQQPPFDETIGTLKGDGLLMNQIDYAREYLQRKSSSTAEEKAISIDPSELSKRLEQINQ